FFKSIHPTRVEGIHGLIFGQVTGQVGVAPEHAASGSVDQKKWRTAAVHLRVYWQQDRWLVAVSTKNFCQLRDCRKLKELYQRKIAAGELFDLAPHFDGPKRVTAGTEKGVMDADLTQCRD